MPEFVLMTLASLAVGIGGLAAILAAVRPDPAPNPPAPRHPLPAPAAPPPASPAPPRPCDRPVYRLHYRGGPCDGLMRKTCRLPGEGEWRDGGWYEPRGGGSGEVAMIFVRHRARAEL